MRNKRKQWCTWLRTLVAVVILAVMMLPANAEAEDLKSGNYRYDILEDGTARITGYTGKETKVVIPSKLGGKKVTEIAAGAFMVWRDVRPGKAINASTVREVVFPDSLKKIGFWNFDNVTSIHIPKNVTYISWGAFGTKNVTRITVDKGNKVYDSRNNCNAIIEKAYDDGTGKKKAALVLGCKNTVIPNTVKIIDGAFKECEITEINIPEGVTTITDDAFWNCEKLKKVTLPKSVKEIKKNPFWGVPSNMVIYAKKGSYAAKWAAEKGYDVNGEGAVNPVEGSHEYTVVGVKGKVKVVSNNKKNLTVEYIETTDDKATTLTVPDSVNLFGLRYKVVGVADYALYGHKNVKKVIVGKNVKYIGREAFKKCTRLESVEVKSPVLRKIGVKAFGGDKNLTKIVLKTRNLNEKSVGENVLKGTNKKLVIKVPKGKVAEYKTYFANKGNKNVKVRK